MQLALQKQSWKTGRQGGAASVLLFGGAALLTAASSRLGLQGLLV